MTDLWSDGHFREHPYAEFDWPEPSRGLVDRKVETTTLTWGTRADVPEFRVLLKTREYGRALPDDGDSRCSGVSRRIVGLVDLMGAACAAQAAFQALTGDR